MKQLKLVLGATFVGVVPILVPILILTLIGRSGAQTVTTPAPVAIACASNTTPPPPTAGQFYYVQCDSSGKIITTGGTSVLGGAKVYSAPGAPGNAQITNSAVVIAGGAHVLYRVVSGKNTTAADCFVQIFDNAAPTLGTTPPTYVVDVPAGGYWDDTTSPFGLQFNNALTVAYTSTATGSAACGATTVLQFIYG